MNTPRLSRLAAVSLLALPFFAASCAKHDHSGHDHAAHAEDAHAGHVHVAPHGGAVVILGDETYHLELVRDAGRGVLQAFVLDGHMENFIRSAEPSFEIVASVDGEKRPLVFLPVSDAATGEKPGDASLFEASAEWLKTTARFDAVLTSITIRGSTFLAVPFAFPEGNGTK